MKRDLSKVVAALFLFTTSLGCPSGTLVFAPPFDDPPDGGGYDTTDPPQPPPPLRDAGASLDVGASRDVPTGLDARADRGPAPPPPPPPPPPPRDVPTDFGPALNVNEFVPVFDALTLDHIRQVRARGVAMNVRANVFAKIGDSITESASYLHDVGFGWYTLGAYAWLEPTITFFRTYRFFDDINSFNRASVCAMGGWRADAALEGDPNSALRRELALTRPAYALVMYGTNDLDHVAPGTFRATLARIVDIIELGGTIAVISTIPDRLDRSDAAARVPMFNDAIRSLANERHLPLMDYWRAMQPLPRRGIEADGIHPSVYVPSSGGGAACGEFTMEGLRAGYNMRNLVSIVMLDRLRNTR